MRFGYVIFACIGATLANGMELQEVMSALYRTFSSFISTSAGKEEELSVFEALYKGLNPKSMSKRRLF